MAKSKYEYVKNFEVPDELMPPNLIVVEIGGHNFQSFSDIHEFEKPNDEKALNLMNSCAARVLEKFDDVVFAYGFNYEYSFVFKKTTNFHNRRASKIISLIASFFSSVYTINWNEFFPSKELRHPPSFHARVISCPRIKDLLQYLASRQNHCHKKNLYNTCLWMLVKGGIADSEAHKRLQDCTKRDFNELLFKEFGMNYNKLPEMFRQGSCIIKTKVESIEKYCKNGTPKKQLNSVVIKVHCKNIAGETFWNGYSTLLDELGHAGGDFSLIEPEYVGSFQFESKLMPCTWIVIRIDGNNFHSFSDEHKFERPNDEHALHLMNSCAVAVLEEFEDIAFSYGFSDEYSFVLMKDSQFYERRASGIVTAVVSFFSSLYVMKWKEFFQDKEFEHPPLFDARVVCYPSYDILRDYFAWRQVDCHINNQDSTCFWKLVKSGMTKTNAHEAIQGKNKAALFQKLGIDYNKLPIMFRLGSFVFWDKVDWMMILENGTSSKNPTMKVVIEHCNIIDERFWKIHPWIVDRKPPML